MSKNTVLDDILHDATNRIALIKDLQALQQLKIEILGKNGNLTQEMRTLGSLDEESRKSYGALINQVKNDITSILSIKEQQIRESALAAKLESEWLDLSLPKRHSAFGTIHPITQCTQELVGIFEQFGFSIKTGPNIETDWYNFTALNMDENHPARQMHDTFYLKNGSVLRTHTTNVEVHTMESEKPPIRMIAPGRTYRSDSDMTHTPMFHQIDGLMVDKGINMGHLKYFIINFIKIFFERNDIEIRFRPSFFPFTEPSAEVDIKMPNSKKWLEVLGCGMLHPNVLKNCKVDDNYKAFAFGLGVERFAMLKYGMKDLRQFFDGDFRWLKHYSFA